MRHYACGIAIAMVASATGLGMATDALAQRGTHNALAVAPTVKDYIRFTRSDIAAKLADKSITKSRADADERKLQAIELEGARVAKLPSGPNKAKREASLGDRVVAIRRALPQAR